MITLKNKETGAFIGEITEEQLQYLTDELEESYGEERDYWLERTEIDFLKESGGDPVLIRILENAIGGNDGIEIVWEKKK
jgi:hypothetical protein